jgi:hypothetical protein
MRSLKKFLFLFVAISIGIGAAAQTVKVKSDKTKLKGDQLDGFSVSLEGTNAAVQASLAKFLKNNGKVKQQSDFITLNEPTIGGTKYTQTLFAVVKEQNNLQEVFIGFKPDDWSKNDQESLDKPLEKYLREFGLKFYHDQIQIQIDEANRAVAAVEKQKQRLQTDGKNFVSKLEDNKKQKIQLEKSLENNKIEHEDLLLRIEKNKVQQDSINVALEQVKKVAEMHKEKQKKIN